MLLKNTLWHGDNIDVLRYLPAESIDVVYLDPPFKKDQNFNMFHRERDGSRSAAQQQAFSDTWQWDAKAAKALRQLLESTDAVAAVMDALRRMLLSLSPQQGAQAGSQMLAYLAMMAPRLLEMRRVLKPSGSLFLHCDPTASHYLKILLDAVFGPANFRNEVIWRRHNARSGRRQFPRVHDVLLFYSRTKQCYFKPVKVPGDPGKQPHTLITGPDGKKYQTFELTGPGATADGESGKPWRGYDPNIYGRHWGNNHATMDKWDEDGLIHWPKDDGFPRRRAAAAFNAASRVVAVGDVWTDIDRLNQTAKERLHYPTQKPEDLIERVLLATTHEKDWVLDPFCGCGTTVAVAERLKRRWIGIDITHLAIDTIVKRLAKHDLKEGQDYKTDGRFAPRTLPDIEAMAHKDKHTFQGWALQQAGIEPFQLKPGPDRGIDGRKVFFDPPTSDQRREIIVSVKGGTLPANCVRDLIGTVQRDRAQVGVLITLRKPTANMVRDANAAPPYRGMDGELYAGIQILTVRDLLDGHIIKYPLQLAPPRALPVVAAAAVKLPALGRTVQQSLLTESELTLLPTRANRMAKATPVKTRAALLRSGKKR